MAICQVDGARWSTVEGTAVVRGDRPSVADAEQRYAARYRVPRPNPKRVVIEITVDRGARFEHPHWKLISSGTGLNFSTSAAW